MSIAEWIEERKLLKLLNPPRYFDSDSDPSKGLWTLCDRCRGILYIKHLKENNSICSSCSYHLRMSSQERLEFLLDKGSWRPLDESLSPCDPLEFHDQKDYTERLKEAQERTGLQDAIQTGSGLVDGIPIAIGVMDFDFMGGSMGSVVGEKVTRLIEYASQEGLTLVLVCASGGARMQEGVLSLMQMAKISSALQVYQTCAKLLYISLLTSPTTGGVTASFAMLGDIIIAEPEALIAFAGRRVIEQTLCEDLPADFQTSEYMFQHGLLDLIVPRRFLRQALSECVRFYVNAPHKKPGRIPFGVQKPISVLVEEKIRRQWGEQDSSTSTVTATPSLAFGQPSVLELPETGPKERSSTPKSQSNRENSESAETGQEGRTLSTQSVDFASRFEKEGEERQELNSFFGARKKSPASSQNSRGVDDLSEALTPTISRAGLQPERDRVEYRNILTSYQTMFDLFSKESILPFSLDQSQSSSLAQDFDEANVNRNGIEESNASSDRLLERFMILSQNQGVSRLGSLDTTPKQIHEEDNSSQSTSNGLSTPQSANTEKQGSSEWKGMSGSSKQTVSSPSSKREDSSYSPNCIDFLNQSIELAGTQVVEWRAFYVHQKISERTGFLEDFAPSSLEYRAEKGGIASQNTLLYRSICKGMSST